MGYPSLSGRALVCPSALLLLLGLGLSLSATVNAVPVTISNTEPRRDVNGELMDLHDGSLTQWEVGGLYYWYGMAYTNCTLETGALPPQDCPGIYRPMGEGCGFRHDHDVSIYSSPNLVDWTYEGSALPVNGPRPVGIYFRPKVIFNPSTSEYVLWVNLLLAEGSTIPLEAYTKTGYVVAAASSPTGPFTIVDPSVSVSVSGGADFGMLVDLNGDGYIAFDAWGNNHQVVVQKLTPDFYGASEENTGPLSPTKKEAPLFFERKGTYYLTWGTSCCFCRWGGGAEVWTAPHPLGPWTLNSDLNPQIGVREHTIRTQPNYVVKAATIDSDTGAQGYTYLFTGDLWTTAHDNLKSHDLQFWQPITFDDSVSPATLSPLYWVDNFTINLDTKPLCPGGSLDACILLCPVSPPESYEECVVECGELCM